MKIWYPMLLRRIKQSLYINILLGVLVAPGIVYAGTYDDFLFAVRFDDSATVQALIKNGADVNSVESERGESALMISIRENSNKVFNDLLASPDINLEARAKNGDTALMLACFLGRKDDVSKLLAKGAKVNQSGWAPLHYAAANGDITIISELLKHDAKIDIQAPNGTTPLMMAVRSGKKEAVILLLNNGANIHAKNSLQMTPLEFAEQVNQIEIAAILKNYAK